MYYGIRICFIERKGRIDLVNFFFLMPMNVYSSIVTFLSKCVIKIKRKDFK